MLLPTKETQTKNTPGSKKHIEPVSSLKKGGLTSTSSMEEINIIMELPEMPDKNNSGKRKSSQTPSIKVPSKKSLVRSRNASAKRALEDNKWACGSCGEKNDHGSFSCQSCDGKLPIITLFKASRRNIILGDPIRLSWEVLECKSVTINPGDEVLESKGVLDVDPDETTEYVLTATNEVGSRKLSVRVGLAAPKIKEFLATDSVVVIDYPTILQWEVENGAELEINMDIGDVSGSSFTEAYLTKPGICTLTATNKSGTDTAQVELFQNMPEISAFYALNKTIKVGEPNVLTWEVSNAEHITIEPIEEDFAGQTTTEVFPDKTTKYILKASNHTGSITEELTLTLPPAKISHFMGNKSVSTEGEPIEISWEVENAYRVMIDNEIGEVEPSGKITVKPTQAYTFYTLRAIGYSGEDARTFQLTRFPIPLEESLIPVSTDLSANMDLNEKNLQESLTQIEEFEKELKRQNQKSTEDILIKRAQEMPIPEDMLSLKKASMRSEIQNIIKKLKGLLRSKRG